MGKIVELKHPLVSHHLATLRDKTTPPHLFREQVRRLSLLLAYEATAELPLKSTTVETPLTHTECMTLDCRLGLVPILRAGLGMSDPIQDLIPQAEVWHFGFYRDESTHQPVEYYQKFSDSPPDIAFIIDIKAVWPDKHPATKTFNDFPIRIKLQDHIQIRVQTLPAEIFDPCITPD